MNPISRMINSFITSTNQLVNSMDKRVAESVKNMFFFLIFILVIVGAVIGIRKGKDAAKIKSQPLAEVTKDVFEIDMKRERGDGNFTTMVESEMINEQKLKDMDKIRYRTRDRLEPDFDKGIIEPDSDTVKKDTHGSITRDRPLDENYRPDAIDRSDTRPLERKSDIRDDGKKVPADTDDEKTRRTMKKVETEKKESSTVSPGRKVYKPGKTTAPDAMKKDIRILED